MDELNIKGSITFDEFSRFPRSFRNALVEKYKIMRTRGSEQDGLEDAIKNGLL